MKAENQIVPRSSGEIVEVVQSDSTNTEAPANPLLVVHSLLRGRYRLAITLMIVGAVIGAPLGYLLIKPEYKSVGIIRVQPILPKILYQTEQNGIMPMFESFLASQVAQIQSRRVTGEAMLQPEWKSLGRGLDPEAVAKFEKSLDVANPKGSPLILVTFTDKDPKAAATAVKAVIEAYQRVYQDTEAESGTPALSLLEARRAELAASLNETQNNILSTAHDFGSSSLKDVYEFKLGELNRVESQLRAAEIQTALAGGAPTTAPTTAQARIDQDNALMSRDVLLQQLMREKLEADRQARMLAAHYGENHPKVEDARIAVKAIQTDIDNRTAELLHAGMTAIPGMSSPAGNSSVPQTREQLKENEIALRRMYEGLKSETIALGQKNLTIEKLRADADEVRERLEETKNRIEQLNLEKNVSGRISVMSFGDVPLLPEKDRRVALTAVGAMGCGGLGVGVVLLMGFLDPRMHHLDTAKSRLKLAERMLGVLPELPNDLTDPEQAAATAHCVHHIRAMLQIRQRVTGHKTFALTSPAPGDGKTSITTTLGLSLATSGARTLLIDCDMDGGGLTSRMGRVARRQLGQILLDYRAIGEAKLEEGLELAKQKGFRIGQALVKLGYVAKTLVEKALKEQRASAPGLGDVLGGVSPEQAILTAGHPLLSLLPLGSPAGAHAGRLAPESLRKLLDRLIPQFDIILIDCGPILGSVEAAIVSAEADGVILVVSRGGNRTTAESSLNLLVSAGANVEGVIFNRANPGDIAGSMYSSSSSSFRSRRSSPAKRDSEGDLQAEDSEISSAT